MQIKTPDAETERFNHELDSVSVVVRHVVVEDCSAPSDHWEHRRAIILALEAEMAHAAWSSPDEGVPLVNYLKANAMTGTTINAEQFLGPLWHVSRQSLIVRGRSQAHYGSYFVGKDEEIDANVVTPRLHTSDGRDAGYAYAFTEPPYSLRVTRPRVIELFAEALRRFLPALHTPGTTLYRWPTDWSRYFDAGHEWWGSFAWTYGAASTSTSGEIVAVFASTTD
jgi:hypothetical protein